MDLPQKHDTQATVWLRPELQASWAEIWIVTTAVIGIGTVSSTWTEWHGSSHHFMADLLTDRRLMRTLTFELGLLGLLFVHLHRRGWTPADLTIRPGWKATGLGLALLYATSWASAGTVDFVKWILTFLPPHSAHFVLALSQETVHPHGAALSWFTLISVSIFNGFFEEIVCMGYAFRQFAAKRGPAFALVVVVLIRMSYHTYQGPLNTLGIGTLFTVSGLCYCWTRNLWPLIFAHILMDMLGLAAAKMTNSH